MTELSALDLTPEELAELSHLASPAAFGARYEPGYIRTKHTDFVSAMFVRAAFTPDYRGIVNIRPRAGKSTVTSILGPAWYLTLFPDRNIINITHELTLASHFSSRARDMLEQHGPHLGVELDPRSTARTEWSTRAGGGMLARGVSGGVVGRGGDIIVMDDPISGFDDAHSKAARDALWDYFRADLMNRLNPGGSILIVMARWHPDDIVGRILSPEHEMDASRWELFNVPAIAGKDDPLGRREAEPIVRPGESASQASASLRQIREDVGPYVFAAQYDGNPSEPEGTVFKREWWQYYGGHYTTDAGPLKLPDRFDARCVSWDMAFKDTADSSYVVGQYWGRRGPNYYLIAQDRARRDFVGTLDAVQRLARSYPGVPHVIEDKANGPAVLNQLRRKISSLIPWPVKDSKLARAHAMTPYCEGGNVILPSPSIAAWIQDWVEEYANFRGGKERSDQVDAGTQGIAYLQKRGEMEIQVPSGTL